MERFLFHAEAYALTGKITSPVHELIPVQAMATLPITGGAGHSRIENFRHRDLIAIGSATTSVTGSQSAETGDDRGPYVSRATVEMRDVSILGMVTIARLYASLSTTIPYDGDEPSIYVHAAIEGLTIGGKPVEVNLETDYFNKLPTWTALSNDLAGGGAKALTLSGSTFKRDIRGFTLLSQSVREMAPTAIAVPNFGKLALGEFFVMPSCRRLSLVRIDLGCPDEGRVELGGVGTNGVGWP